MSIEDDLIDKAQCGEWLDLGRDVPHPADATRIIEAKLLRSLMLGLHPRCGNACAPAKPGRIVAIRIRGAIIDGRLDLRGCCDSQGTPLPPLLLHDCLIRGDIARPPNEPVIDARRAQLGRLSLSRSKVGRIDLSFATLRGDLEIDGIQPIDVYRACQVLARECVVSGSVNASRVQLRIPADQMLDDFPSVADYALNLAGARISGDVFLQPDFHSDGGVNVAGARVSGCIWAEGCELSTSGETAFRAERLQCEVVALRSGKNGTCKIHGRVDFLNATIGQLDLSGISIEEARSHQTNPSILQLALATIHYDVLLRSADKTNPTIVGGIFASGCNIGGDLEISKVTLRKPLEGKDNADIVAANLRVGGNLTLHDFDIDGWVFLDGSRVEHTLTCHYSDSANARNHNFSARNIQVGDDLRFLNPVGRIDLELARVGGALKVEKARGVSMLNAKDADVRGSVEIGGTFAHNNDAGLCFDGGNYHGAFVLEAEIVSSLNDDRVMEVRPAVTIEDASIERDLNVKRILSRRPNALDGNVTARYVRPSFYPGWMLVEASSRADGRDTVVAYLQQDAHEPKLLPGRAAPIHEMNAQGHLTLDDGNVLDYLRFFCAYVWGDEGAFLIVEDGAAAGLLAASSGTGSAPESPAPRVGPATVKGGNARDGWDCSAFVRYASHLFKAEFHVAPDGNIEMRDDSPVAELATPAPESFAPPLRIGASGTTPDSFWLKLICTDAEVQFLPPNDLTQALKRLSLHPTAITRISLKGLSAGALHYHPETSWGKDVILEIEGFEYHRIEFERDQTKTEVGADFEASTQVDSGRAVRRRRFIHDSHHIHWLRLQYPGGQLTSSDTRFTPQPYEQLARVLRNEGHEVEAKCVIFEKLSLERRFKHAAWTQPFLWIWEFFFRHGLFVGRSLITFLAVLALGVCGYFYAIQEHVLVVNSMTVSSVVMPPTTAGGGEPAIPISDSLFGAVPELPCVGKQSTLHDLGDSIFFALDTIQPVINLHQAEKCSISGAKSSWWRWGKVLYAIIGMIVSSLTLLCVSGVVRRYLER